MHAGNGMPAARAALARSLFPLGASHLQEQMSHERAANTDREPAPQPVAGSKGVPAALASTGINITKRGKIQLAIALMFAETVTSITMHVLVR